MLQKFTVCEIFKKSHENVNDGVCFSKVASRQGTHCKSTINRLQLKVFG